MWHTVYGIINNRWRYLWLGRGFKYVCGCLVWHLKVWHFLYLLFKRSLGLDPGGVLMTLLALLGIARSCFGVIRGADAGFVLPCFLTINSSNVIPALKCLRAGCLNWFFKPPSPSIRELAEKEKKNTWKLEMVPETFAMLN